MATRSDTVYRHPYQDFWESLKPGDLVYVCENRFGAPYVFDRMKFRVQSLQLMDSWDDRLYPEGSNARRKDLSKNDSCMYVTAKFNAPYEFTGFMLTRTKWSWKDWRNGDRIVIEERLPNRTTFKTGIPWRLQPFPLELLSRVQLMEYNNMRRLMNLHPVTIKRT
jgi:hypothetical protein